MFNILDQPSRSFCRIISLIAQQPGTYITVSYTHLVALFYVSTETGFVLEVIVLERDAAVLAGIEAQGMVKVAADAAGLAGDSYGEHLDVYKRQVYRRL